MSQPFVNFSTHPEPMLNVVLNEPFLDITVQEGVREAVERAWRDSLRAIEIDFSAVEFVDSSGVGLLVAFHKKLGGASHRVILKNVKPAIRGVFALLCLEDLFLFS